MNKCNSNEFEDELFDDSSLLANFVDSTFGDERSNHANQSNKNNSLNIRLVNRHYCVFILFELLSRYILM